MKRYIARSSTTYVPRLTRAIAQKAQFENKGDQKFNVAATFPDDIEDSPLKSKILEKRNRNPGIDDSYHPNIYEIYESMQGNPPSPPKSAKIAKPAQKKKPDPVEEEREPELDEL
ncbi:hypothetical protein PITC_036270 [Penicillium italicum]|uniref:Uncharacterized protein n=1 Tax=Penicillium italicum TaxID=40296 RepID=A0A0A2LEE0_PENIT|nr:hypothetical protein PITC_036270 [Penicillium italicum]